LQQRHWASDRFIYLLTVGPVIVEKVVRDLLSSLIDVCLERSDFWPFWQFPRLKIVGTCSGRNLPWADNGFLLRLYPHGLSGKPRGNDRMGQRLFMPLSRSETRRSERNAHHYLRDSTLSSQIYADIRGAVYRHTSSQKMNQPQRLVPAKLVAENAGSGEWGLVPLDRYFIQQGEEDTGLILFGVNSEFLFPQFTFK